MTFVKSPTEVSDKWIVVRDISSKATDDSVKEFFAFCGKIVYFEIAAASNGADNKECLICFDSSSAANTARMLSSAVIADKPISVSPYFDEFAVLKTGEMNENGAEESVGDDASGEK